MTTNRYRGRCRGCQKEVRSFEGKLERNGKEHIVWCMSCFKGAPPEDRNNLSPAAWERRQRELLIWPTDE
jgi:hypothetical protein